jgi:hypothetical protein
MSDWPPTVKQKLPVELHDTPMGTPLVMGIVCQAVPVLVATLSCPVPLTKYNRVNAQVVTAKHASSTVA